MNVFDPDWILSILDDCCDAFTFPMLDNGYWYLAATRLSLFRSTTDWALAFEVFGHSPRVGLPDLHITTFASRLHQRNSEQDFVDSGCYEAYLSLHPHDDLRVFSPVEDGHWLDMEKCELVSGAEVLKLRGKSVPLPPLDAYAAHGIALESPPPVFVFELCRYLAAVAREDVLATSDEQRVSVMPDMVKILQLEEWHHPDVVEDTERPSGSETFRQLAEVLATGDVSRYHPSLPPNTHWSNWPDGGTL